MKFTVKATIYDKKNQVVATAVNSYSKTHPTQAHYANRCGEPHKQYLHAEIACLIKAKGKGYKLVVERYNKQGLPMLAMPCKICMMAIKEAKHIKRIEYTL
jgi:tRNA(Arg) A34 adenosine deaminase TadA